MCAYSKAKDKEKKKKLGRLIDFFTTKHKNTLSTLISFQWMILNSKMAQSSS